MKPVFFLFAFLIAGISASSAQNDSLGNAVGAYFTKGEVVVDLKNINLGLRNISVPQPKQGKGTPPEGSIEVNNKGEIIIQQPDALTGDFYSLAVKAECNDSTGSVMYENIITIAAKNDKITTTVVTDKIEMANFWRQDGKIWVVIAVSLVLFATIILFLIFMERKLRKLEKH